MVRIAVRVATVRVVVIVLMLIIVKVVLLQLVGVSCCNSSGNISSNITEVEIMTVMLNLW